MSQKTKLAFIASIVLNVLLVGVLLGQSPRRFDPGSMREQRMEQAIKDLPPASQTRLRERFKQLRATAEPLFGQMRQVQDESARLLAVEPFDEAAFDRQVKKINDLRLQMTDILKDAAKNLPPDERRALGETMKRPSGTSSR